MKCPILSKSLNKKTQIMQQTKILEKVDLPVLEIIPEPEFMQIQPYAPPETLPHEEQPQGFAISAFILIAVICGVCIIGTFSFVVCCQLIDNSMIIGAFIVSVAKTIAAVGMIAIVFIMVLGSLEIGTPMPPPVNKKSGSHSIKSSVVNVNVTVNQ